jgi:hypothetical protein
VSCLFSFFGSVRGRLLQALGVGLQPLGVWSALWLDGGLIVGTRTTRRREKAKRENQEQKLFHSVEAIGVIEERCRPIAIPLRRSQQSQKRSAARYGVRRSSNTKGDWFADYRGA